MKITWELKFILIGLFLVGFASCQKDGQKKYSSQTATHPCLVLTNKSVPQIIKGLPHLPLLQASFSEIKANADRALEEGIIVPVPKDPGGGYTHEQHKQNYVAMYNAGICYQLTGNEKYGLFVKEMLLDYATLYPTLNLHPARKSQAPGKLFWQGLNESVWLVYTIQAYDCIYNYLSVEDRQNIEENLFRKVVEFFTIDESYSFNSVHNHGTWATVGVGMTGMVIGDTNYVEMALYGTDKSGNAGFLKQINELFSPDGYYAEGPYYQRYAIMPFMLFAQALNNNRKDIKIFEFKNGVLNKAVITLLQLTNSDGRFYPLNDAIKEKDFLSPEMDFAISIAYNNTQNAELLSIARKHSYVMMSIEGLKVAEAVNSNKAIELNRNSMLISDGNDGTQGGIAILRRQFDQNQVSVILKATSQGMGHGHFDRLSFLMYENGKEIIQDYGAARFLNIEEKQGGRYLPENVTWAKQTIAHNTVVINGKSNFNGNLKEASKYHPDVLYTDFDSQDIQLVAVADSHCYKNAVLQRTMALIKHNHSPVVIDLFRIINSKKSTYDYSVYYQGQLISTNFKYGAALKQLDVLGTENGYQHLWKVAHANKLNGIAAVTWLNNNRFYTCSFVADMNSELFFTKIGANDPDFNLRNEQGLMIRQNNAINHSFISVIETHGKVDPIQEKVAGTKSSLKALNIIYQDEDVSVIKLDFTDDTISELFLSHYPDKEARHEVLIDGSLNNWVGNFLFKTYKK